MISTDGYLGRQPRLRTTLFADNIPVARSRTGIGTAGMRNVAPGQHRIRVVGIDSEGYADSRESVVLVGDYVGLLGTVTPSLQRRRHRRSSSMGSSDKPTPRSRCRSPRTTVETRAERACRVRKGAAQVCVSEGSTCEDSAESRA